MHWNADRIDLMLRLKGEGLTALEIAEHFAGLGLKVTRNAVIGKIFRVRHPDYRPHKRKAAKPARKMNGKLKAVWSSAGEAVIRLKPNQCRFMLGEPPARVAFCPRRAKDPSSYCLKHQKVVYRTWNEDR